MIQKLLALSLGVAPVLPAQTTAFQYQPRRVPVGTVFHYVRTNIDGTQPEQIALYVAGPDRLEVFKYHPNGQSAALVTALLDWGLFSAVRLESLSMWRDSSRVVATLAYDRSARAADVTVMGQTQKLPIGVLPFHVYSFDLASLNVMLPHLRDPETRFTVSVADPTYRADPVMEYRGEIELAYQATETRAGQTCRVYRVTGPGIANRSGTIWVRRSDGFIQDLEIDLPANPQWNTFKLRLLRRENLTRPRWEAFQKAQFGAGGASR